MKYPFVIFYRDPEYQHVDEFFIGYAEQLQFTVFIADSMEYVMNLHNSNFHILISYEKKSNAYPTKLLNYISESMLVRVFDNFDCFLARQLPIDVLNETINKMYARLTTLDREMVRPTFSVFTTAFNSFHKILRVYNSLKEQTLKDWEWVIVDDSPDDNNFAFLREHFSNDPRIRFFRKSSNNGSIGYVKNEAIGLCRGKYLLEMDHDDEILPYVLQESADLFHTNNDVGFIYFDCACIYENGNNQWYGDFICKGYGGYYSQKYKDKWRLVYITPNINNITLSHLVCCPNHPRIWRRQTLFELGSYSEYLPICDDYEILLRTAVKTNMAKIHKLGYIQYMNESNNNFSLIRNAEINRIGPNYISPEYYQTKTFNIPNAMKQKNAYEDEMYLNNCSKIWERPVDTYQHKYCNLLVNNSYDKQFCIIGLDSLIANLTQIAELYENERNDFIVLENKCGLEYLQERLERFGFDRMKCYTLIDTPEEQLIRYFKLLYASVSEEQQSIINIGLKKLNYNTNLNSRFQIINKLTTPHLSYLEIGVEYGECMQNVHFTNKIGVDPDPKFVSNNSNVVIAKLTSDEFFQRQSSNATFDVVFIDGMHQVEYFTKDLNNSIKHLSDNGLIFIDDIIPLNYHEQLKIPIKHKYENGILKYGENWTGDVWRVIYHILKHYKEHIQLFAVYHNIHYRGLAVCQFDKDFSIPLDEIDEINEYSYFDHFADYLSLLNDYQGF